MILFLTNNGCGCIGINSYFLGVYGPALYVTHCNIFSANREFLRMFWVQRHKVIYSRALYVTHFSANRELLRML